MSEDNTVPKPSRVPWRLRAAPRVPRGRWEPFLLGALVLVVGLVVAFFQLNLKRFEFDYAIASEHKGANQSGYSLRSVTVTLDVRYGDLRLVIADYLKRTTLAADYYNLTLARTDTEPIRVGLLSRKLITHNLAQDYGYLDQTSQPYIQGKWGDYKIVGERFLDG